MIITFLQFSRYFIAMLFGTAVAAHCAGMPRKKKDYIALNIFVIAVFILQVFCLRSFGMDMTLKIYPLIAHLPIVLFIVMYLKSSWLIAFTSMFVSFLCCQLPRWFGAIVGLVSRNPYFDHIGYNVTAICMYLLLNKYVMKSISRLIARSAKSCILFASMPFFYYIFDYGSTVYTNFMYSGSRVAIQFMPFATSVFYLIFVLLYYGEIQKQTNMQREHNMLDAQFKQAKVEFASLRAMQHNAATYRHDMRHHITLLQSLAQKEQYEAMKEYLVTAQSDIDSITPIRYCENETVNLILSSYANKARHLDIHITIDASLVDDMPFSDTELCSLLSNALENAIHATKLITTIEHRRILLRIYEKNTKLCIDLRNTYLQEPVFHNDLPTTKEEGHGFGTKSMVHIIEKHGGVYQFLVKDGWFIFQATT